MPCFALIFFIALSLLVALFLLALSRWWSPPAVERDPPPRPDIRLPLHSYRPLFFVLIGETVLLLFCAWAVHFKVGLAVGRAHLNEMEFFALVVFVGLFYLWRKGCADERG